MLSCEQKQALHQTAEKLRTCKISERSELISACAKVLGLADKSVRRHLEKECGWKPTRKSRSDKGKSLISMDYAAKVAGIQKAATRETGKVLLSVEQSAEILASNNIMPVNPKTGEAVKVTASTINRKLKDYGLHAKQLKRGTPSQSLRSLHPNHVWQIDASVCVLFYLPNNKIRILDETEYYKNKPQNLEKISKERVVRYVVTDHYSGFVYVRYELGSEDAMGVVNTLIEAISKRTDEDPMHGVPKILVLDKGAGNMSGIVKSFCEKLGIQLLPHSTGNARAKGQVENANNLVEKAFEGRLRFLDIASLEELQKHCDLWRCHYNARSILRRTGKSRSALWTTIKNENLRICDKEVLQEIAVWQHVVRKINGKFQISLSTKKFGKNVYDVSALGLHNINISDEVEVFLNPFTAPDITAVKKLFDGTEIRMDFSPINLDEAGFSITAPVIGEEHKAFTKTSTEKNLELLEKLAYGTKTAEEAEEKKKRKERPFSDLDFMADIKKSPVFIHAEGKNAFEKEPEPLSLTQTAMIIRERAAELWMKNPKKSMEWIKQKGSTFSETMLDELTAEFRQTFEPKATHIPFSEAAKCAG